MLPYYENSPCEYLEAEIGRLKQLVADLEWLACKQSPSEDCLRSAPLLDPFTITVHKVACLKGTAHNHPRFKDHKTIVTAPIYLMVEDHTWARTEDRYYRLGRPLTDSFSTD